MSSFLPFILKFTLDKNKINSEIIFNNLVTDIIHNQTIIKILPSNDGSYIDKIEIIHNYSIVRKIHIHNISAFLFSDNYFHNSDISILSLLKKYYSKLTPTHKDIINNSFYKNNSDSDYQTYINFFTGTLAISLTLFESMAYSGFMSYSNFKDHNENIYDSKINDMLFGPIIPTFLPILELNIENEIVNCYPSQIVFTIETYNFLKYFIIGYNTIKYNDIFLSPEWLFHYESFWNIFQKMLNIDDDDSVIDNYSEIVSIHCVNSGISKYMIEKCNHVLSIYNSLENNLNQQIDKTKKIDIFFDEKTKLIDQKSTKYMESLELKYQEMTQKIKIFSDQSIKTFITTTENIIQKLTMENSFTDKEKNKIYNFMKTTEEKLTIQLRNETNIQKKSLDDLHIFYQKKISDLMNDAIEDASEKIGLFIDSKINNNEIENLNQRINKLENTLLKISNSL